MSGDQVARAPFGSRVLGEADQTPHQLRVRVQTLLTALLVTTNVAGAVIVFVISFFVVPGPAPSDATLLSLAIAVPAYVVLAVVLGAVVGTRWALGAVRWAMSDREPDDAERRSALRVPLHITVVHGSLWLGGTVVFTVLALALQRERALTTGLSVFITALITSAICYLLTEFALRPVSARALADIGPDARPRGAGVGDRMLIFWWLGTGAPVVGLVLAALLSIGRDDTTKVRLAVICLVLGGVVLVFGSFITLLNARSVVAPILSVRDALLQVERGDLDGEVVVYDGTELGLLQSGFNEMVGGLRERERIRDLFGRHVGVEVARAAAAGEVELGGEQRTASVLFVDLVGSTTYATEHTPTEVVTVLNRFFGVVVDEVDAHGGFVNKFIGDAVLAIFGTPVDLPGHAGAALAAARSMAARLAEEVPEVGAGIGVATGEVVAGNVGHASRFEYTVIGDAVNSAARLTELAKDAPGRVLVMLATVDAAERDEASYWTRHESPTLRGRSTPTPVAVLRTST